MFRAVARVLEQAWLYLDALRPIAELDGLGNVVSTFIYATGLNVPDYMVRGGVTYRILRDHLGSVRLVVDVATGTVAQRMEHDEWGRVVVDTAPGFQPFGYSGGLWDSDTGLVHFGAREYDPETGRWTSKDPIGFGGGDANSYGCVLGDPFNGFDPGGLRPVTSEEFNEWFRRNFDRDPFGDIRENFIANLAALFPDSAPPRSRTPIPHRGFPSRTEVSHPAPRLVLAAWAGGGGERGRETAGAAISRRRDALRTLAAGRGMRRRAPDSGRGRTGARPRWVQPGEVGGAPAETSVLAARHEAVEVLEELGVPSLGVEDAGVMMIAVGHREENFRAASARQ